MTGSSVSIHCCDEVPLHHNYKPVSLEEAQFQFTVVTRCPCTMFVFLGVTAWLYSFNSLL